VDSIEECDGYNKYAKYSETKYICLHSCYGRFEIIGEKECHVPCPTGYYHSFDMKYCYESCSDDPRVRQNTYIKTKLTI